LLKSKTWLISLLLIALLTVSVTVAAAMLIPASDRAKEQSKADKSPVIERVGDHLVLTPPGLEKKVFIHYAKPPCNNDGVCDAGENKSCSDCKRGGEEPKSSCYGFIGRGVEWKELPQGYVIDPDNPFGLSESFVVSAISAGAEEWDAHTGTSLFSGYTVDYAASWDDDAPDGRNELLFGDYPEPGVIGIAVTWGYFSGPPKNRRIIEFDVLFDTDFEWGNADTDPNVMDLQNIAVHEIGHGLGLDDLYENSCAEETMYGYSTEGETKKRSLEAGDITGIQKLYGS